MALPISRKARELGVRKAKTSIPFPSIRKCPLQALTNSGAKLAKGSAGLLFLLPNSAQDRMDTQAPLFWRIPRMFKALC